VRTEFNGIRTYFLTDHLGSTRALTDANGNIIQRYDYTPYGQTTATSSAFSNPYQYTGRELDQSGLYYYRARYYSPQMGRFISEDPIGLRGGINTYGYVEGNPVNLIDPEGGQARRVVPARPPTTSEIFAREQVPYLVREIQRHDPSFRYQTVGPRGQQYNRQDVDFLRDILRHRQNQDRTCPVDANQNGNRNRGLPAEGEPFTWINHPFGKQSRYYGPNGRPLFDIDRGHDHGQGVPHAHNWVNGVRGPGVQVSDLP
jgi:RHS repeat-associated protein